VSTETASTASPARPTAALSGAESGRTLAGLLDVLDRADVPASQRARTRRPAVDRPEAYRRGTARRQPLRSVPQAPPARPLPTGALPAAAPAQARVPAVSQRPGPLRALTRRVALWGAGLDGEYLAWRGGGARAATSAAHTGSVATAPAARRPSRLRALTRRLALWGAGVDGEYLAWFPPGRTAASGEPADRRPLSDRPVVLREMPSTPTIQPAASSPAAALLPRGPASSAGPRGARPVSSGAVPVPGIRPGGRLERSGATGWPSPARPSPAGNGLVRSRGDPLSCPVRGSPPPARRARSPGSPLRSPFPRGPSPRTDPGVSRA
jgi:hypothetical protein